MRFFFYGTLIDPDVRTLVLGEMAANAVVRPAVLTGWQAVRVLGKTYPVVTRRRGVAEGVLADNLPDDALGHLAAYEGPEYDVANLDVIADGDETPISAKVFVGAAACRASTAPWRYEDWERRHKRQFLASLRARRAV